MRDSNQFGDNRPSATRNPITVAKKMPITETKQRVEQTHEEHAGVGVGSGIGDQVLADVKTCRVLQKPEPGGDPLRLQVGAGVGDDLVADPDQRRDEHDLEGKSSPAGTTAERPLQPEGKLRRWCPGLDAHRHSLWASDQRIGGAYWIPPLFQS